MTPEQDPELMGRGPLTFIGYIADSEDFVADMKARRQGTPGGKLGETYEWWHRNHRRYDRRTHIAVAVKARNDHEAGNPPPNGRYSVRARDEFPIPIWTPPVPFAATGNDDEDDSQE